MQLFNVFLAGAALLGALLVMLPALGIQCFKPFGDWQPKRGLLRSVFWELLTGEAGVVVVTYTWPATAAPPGTTAPTAVQASPVPVQTMQVFFADTDTQAVVTHNKGLPASFPVELYPIVIMTKSLGGASDSSFQTNFTIGKTNTNSITINKLSVGTGSGGTYDVALIFGVGPWQK